MVPPLLSALPAAFFFYQQYQPGLLPPLAALPFTFDASFGDAQKAPLFCFFFLQESGVFFLR